MKMIIYEHLLLITAIIVIWNIITFIIYGIDKRKAIKGNWRISESALLSCTLLMGSIGALLGIKIFNHKTKKMKFKLGVPICLIINVIICLYIYVMN